MRDRIFRRIMAAVFTGLMVISAAGCGSSGNTESTADDVAKSTGQPVDIRIFSGYSAADESDSSKFMVSEMEKILNINLIRDEVPSSAYQEKLQLALSDGDYPDAFIFNLHYDSMLLSAIDNGLIISINEYMEKGNYPNLERYIYEGAWEAAKLKNDDEIYLIPRCTVARVDGFSIREDWLNNIGVQITSDEATVTKEEFINILKKFCEEDPDGDGIDNTYGFAFPKDTNKIPIPIASGAFDVVGWQPSNGEYDYMSPEFEIGNQNYKELLAFNQEVYKYAHPDSLTAEPSDLSVAGQVGITQSFAGHVIQNQNQINEVDADAKCTYISGVVNDEGVLQGATNLPGIWGGIAITKNCENPEKILEMVDWLLSDEAWEYALYGIPDVTYTVETDGKIILNEEAYKANKTGGVSVWATTIARRKEDARFFMDMSLPKAEYEQQLKWIETSVDAVVFEPHLGKQPAISTDTAFIEAENARMEAIGRIIMGGMEVDEYDEILQNWYSKGGDVYVQQMNEIIAGVVQ